PHSRPISGPPATAVSPTFPVSGPPSSQLPPEHIPSPTNPVTTPGPLPSNVASALDTIYEEFEHGTLPASQSGPGQIEIQGNAVGVMIHVTNPADFASVSADAQALGLQVPGISPETDNIAGWLPIAELPAVAQLSDAPIIVPIYGPMAT